MDEQDKAEQLDDLDNPVRWDTDRPTASLDYGTTPQEERVPEPIAERVKREVPEQALAPDDQRVTTDDGDTVVVAEDDLITGDETTRDVATEREAPPPAEEAALHVTENP